MKPNVCMFACNSARMHLVETQRKYLEQLFTYTHTFVYMDMYLNTCGLSNTLAICLNFSCLNVFTINPYFDYFAFLSVVFS